MMGRAGSPRPPKASMIRLEVLRRSLKRRRRNHQCPNWLSGLLDSPKSKHGVPRLEVGLSTAHDFSTPLNGALRFAITASNGEGLALPSITLGAFAPPFSH